MRDGEFGNGLVERLVNDDGVVVEERQDVSAGYGPCFCSRRIRAQGDLVFVFVSHIGHDAFLKICFAPLSEARNSPLSYSVSFLRQLQEENTMADSSGAQQTKHFRGSGVTKEPPPQIDNQAGFFFSFFCVMLNKGVCVCPGDVKMNRTRPRRKRPAVRHAVWILFLNVHRNRGDTMSFCRTCLRLLVPQISTPNVSAYGCTFPFFLLKGGGEVVAVSCALLLGLRLDIGAIGEGFDQA